jgi:hypothetical protein
MGYTRTESTFRWTRTVTAGRQKMTCGATANLIMEKPLDFVFPPPTQTAASFSTATFLGGLMTPAIAAQLFAAAPPNAVLTLPASIQAITVSVTVTIIVANPLIQVQAPPFVQRVTTITLGNLVSFSGTFTQEVTETVQFGLDITQISATLDTFTVGFFDSIKATSNPFVPRFNLIFQMNEATGMVGMDCKIDFEETVPGGAEPLPRGSPAFNPFDVTQLLTQFTTSGVTDLIIAATPVGFGALPTLDIGAIGIKLLAVEKLVVPPPLPVLQRVTSVSVGNLLSFTVPFVPLSIGGLVFGVDVSGFISGVSVKLCINYLLARKAR